MDFQPDWEKEPVGVWLAGMMEKVSLPKLFSADCAAVAVREEVWYTLVPVRVPVEEPPPAAAARV